MASARKTEAAYKASTKTTQPKSKKASGFLPVWTVAVGTFTNDSALTSWVSQFLNSLPPDRAASAKISIASYVFNGKTSQRTAYISYLT